MDRKAIAEPLHRLCSISTYRIMEVYQDIPYSILQTN